VLVKKELINKKIIYKIIKIIYKRKYITCMYDKTGPQPRESKGEPGEGWAKRPDAAEANSGMGQVLQKSVRRFRPPIVDRRDSLLHRVLNSGHDQRGPERRQSLPGHRPRGGRDSDGYILVLPGEQVEQDHGVVQEHGAAIRHRNPGR